MTDQPWQRRLSKPTSLARPLSTASIVALSMLAITGVMIALGWVLARDANQALTRQTTEAIKSDIAAARLLFRIGGLQALHDRVADPSLGSTHAIRAPDGRVLAGGLRLSPAQMHRLASGEVVAAHVGHAAPLSDQVSIVVARDISEQIAVLERLRWRMLASLICLSLIAAIAAALVQRRSARRVAGVIAATSKIVAGNLTVRIPDDRSGDEFETLVSNVNAMLHRIEELMATVRDVSDNIAHDLRTPLNRLRNNAEEALKQPQGSPRHVEALQRIIVEADDVIRTFNAMLELARLESSKDAAAVESVDVSATVRDMAEFYQPVAEDEGFVVRVMIEDGLRVAGNRQLLGQVLSNLFDNALKYGRPHRSERGQTSPHGLEITVDVAQRGSGVEIVVADRGPGIAATDHATALKRFGRIDASRSMPGTGLGLNLVAAIVRRHHGTLTLENNDPGLRVRVRLPVELPASSRG